MPPGAAAVGAATPPASASQRQYMYPRYAAVNCELSGWVLDPL